MKATTEMTGEVKECSRLIASYWHLKMRYRREICLSWLTEKVILLTTWFGTFGLGEGEAPLVMSCHVRPNRLMHISLIILLYFVTQEYIKDSLLSYVFLLLLSDYFNSLQWKLCAEWAFYCNVYDFVKIWLQKLMTHWVPGRTEQLFLRNSKKNKRKRNNIFLTVHLSTWEYEWSPRDDIWNLTEPGSD